jgi:serine/threonine-protein kinase
VPQLRFTPSGNRSIALSPDGSLLAADVLGSRGPDIRVKQLPAGPFIRLTFEGSQNLRPSWTADGKSLIYLSNRDSAPLSVWRQQADGARPAELVLRGSGSGIQEAVLSRDGKWLLYRTTEAGTRNVYAIRPGHDTTRVPLLVTRFNEEGIALSRDGRWLAYSSDESGRSEVYVRPFPDINTGRWQISGGGGSAARWAHSGRELFFQGPANEIMVSAVRTAPSFQPGDPRQLIAPQTQIMPSVVIPNYAVTPDDRRFLMVRLASADAPPGAGQLVVVENWFREFQEKVKARR